MTLNGNLRPQQPGRVVGRPAVTLGLQPVEDHAADVVWLVDSGANITTVRKCIGEQFGYKPIDAAYAVAANGQKFGLVVEDLRAEFSVEDQVGTLRTVQTSKRMCIAEDNACADLLGMDHVSAAGATLVWNPSEGAGTLRGNSGILALAGGLIRRLIGG